MNYSEKGRTHGDPLKLVAGSCVGAAGLFYLIAPPSPLWATATAQGVMY